MGKKRKIISNPKKFGRKFAAHPVTTKAAPEAESVPEPKPEPKPKKVAEKKEPEVKPAPKPKKVAEKKQPTVKSGPKAKKSPLSKLRKPKPSDD